MSKKTTHFNLEVTDCIAGMKRLPQESVDIVVTSPPYNLGIKYGNYDDTQSRGEYLKWSAEWALEVKRVLKEKGSFFLNVGASPSNPLAPHELLMTLISPEVGYKLQNTFHWIKSITVKTRNDQEISAGHFKPINSSRYVNDCHEYIFHLTKTGDTPLHRLNLGVKYTDKSNINRWAHTSGRDVRCRGNNWFIPYKTILSRSKDRPHPATFPVELAVNCLKIHGCDENSVMLDPFVGIGHSALAARECGIGQFTGFDLDAEYVQVATALLKNGIIEPPEKKSLPAKRHKKSVAEDLLFDL